MAHRASSQDSDERLAEASLSAMSKERVRPLLQLNDQLRLLAVGEKDIHVTTIVAVGDQSHGKTSVIEALSGIHLPRGKGIQTRIPLVLALRGCDVGEKEYAVIDTGNSEERKTLHQLSGIADEVRSLTNKLAGGLKDVVNKPLNLTVYRHDQDDLTLIDLPGMTRVPIQGQQSDDIEEVITAMYREYMTPQETVLLNVVAATADFSTSASLKLSQELDKTGERTLLCVTKVDMITNSGILESIHAAEENFHCPVFAVMNRSEESNKDNVPLEVVRRKEREFFKEHSELRNLEDSRKGVGALSSKLVDLQTERIRATLPTSARALLQRKSEVERELSNCARKFESDLEVRDFLHERFQTAARHLEDQLLGRGTSVSSRSHQNFDLNSIDFEIKELDKKVAVETTYGQYHFKLSVGTTTTDDWNMRVIHVNFIACTLPKDVSRVEGFFHLNGKNWPFKGANKTIVSGELTQNGNNQSFPLKCTLYIQLIKRVEHTEPSTPMLCALVMSCDEQLRESIARLYPPYYFDSPGFLAVLKEEANARRGAWLVGGLSPDISARILNRLRKPLETIMLNHVNKVADLTEDAYKKAFVSFVDHMEQLTCVTGRAIHQHMNEQRNGAHKLVSQILDLENSMHTLNHYYMDTVQKKREENQKNPNILKLSNEDQKLIDMQTEISAYWKVMTKRLIDYVSLTARSHCIQKPMFESGLTKSIYQGIELASNETQVDGGLVALCKPSVAELRKRERLEKRLEKLVEANRLLENLL